MTGQAPLLLVAAIGVLGGFMSGAFGIGGGIVVVPLLLLVLNIDQRVASTLSLMAIVPSSIIGAFGYLSTGAVDLGLASWVALGGIVGGYLGAKLAARISIVWLRWGFIALMLLIALRLLITVPSRTLSHIDLNWSAIVAGLMLGLVIGIASGLFGIGGGLIMVPIFILLFGASDLVAKGTSLAVMAPTALSGVITGQRHNPVSWRDGITLGVGSLFGSLPGVWVAYLINPEISVVLFAAILILAIGQLVLRAVRAK